MPSIVGILDSVLHERQGDRGTWLVGCVILDGAVNGKSPLGEDVGRYIPVKGTIAGQPSIGGSYRFTGTLQDNPPYGRQFCFTVAESIRPASVEGIRRYLESTLKHVGPATSRAIVDEFGEKTLDILDAHPEKLLSFSGITPARLEVIKSDWADNARAREANVSLCQFGLSRSQIGRLVAVYSSPSCALDQVRANPYTLIEDIHGIGWARADHLASRTGITSDDPRRARAAAYHILQEAAGEGHTYLPEEDLVNRARKLNVASEAIVEGAKAHTGITDLTHVSSPEAPLSGFALISYWDSEFSAAAKLREMFAASTTEASISDAQFDDITSIGKRNNLDDDQLAALHSACIYRISVITGGPGTGKTTSIKAILQAWREVMGLNSAADIALAAPTGKASQRLTESTGIEAVTIHRLLAWTMQEMPNAEGRMTHFRFNSADPLSYKAIILDETSMLDAELFRDLTDALTPAHRLLLVGDIDQLPSVGAGAVLRDVIDSGRFPVSRLTKVHRQEEGSSIISTAHAVNQGLIPVIDNAVGNVKFYRAPTMTPNGDEFSPGTVAATIAQNIIALLAPGPNSLPALIEGIDPIRDIQVLCPGKAGACGTIALNTALQAVLNPPAQGKPELRFGGWADENDAPAGNGASSKKSSTPDRVLRQGDRVIQTRNDYKLEVFNGDVGVIKNLIPRGTKDPVHGHLSSKDVLTITFDDGRTVTYEGLDQCYALHLAYALTCHKSQGSEYLIVILPVHTTHAMLLKRNLIYTAITRAKDYCIIIGTDKALSMAVRNNAEEKRFTLLREFLKSKE